MAFLPANWVCRNNLNLHIHLERPGFLERHCNNPAFLRAQCLCVAKAFVLLGSLVLLMCKLPLYIPTAGRSHDPLMFLSGSMEDIWGQGERPLQAVLSSQPHPPRFILFLKLKAVKLTSTICCWCSSKTMVNKPGSP